MRVNVRAHRIARVARRRGPGVHPRRGGIDAVAKPLPALFDLAGNRGDGRRHLGARRSGNGRDMREGGVMRVGDLRRGGEQVRSEEHTSELQSIMSISYAVFCLKKTMTNRKSSRSVVVTRSKPAKEFRQYE